MSAAVSRGVSVAETDLLTAEQPSEAISAVRFPDTPPDVAADVPMELCVPIGPDDPCGPDLDLEGDADYLNFVAHTEGILPSSFFSLDDKKPFDRSSVDLPGRLAAIAPLLERTRDVRLMVLRARLSILNRDLAGFAESVAVMADWLDRFWDTVHPRPGGDGDVVMRVMAISELDGPMVLFPLQYAPLFEMRRQGAITYRAWMIANGEANLRPAETKLAPSAIVEARTDAAPEALATSRQNVASVKASLDRIRSAFAVRGSSAGLEGLVSLVEKIMVFVDPSAGAQTIGIGPADDPTSGTGGGHDENGRPTTGAIGEAPNSLSQARDALAAIADYYSSMEPSSPTLPLVRQAHQLIGKSFFEVLTILIPTQLDKAAFQIGGDQIFELPIGKLSALSAVAPVAASAQESISEQATGAPRYRVGTRSQAIALLDQVQRFFRQSEPSSPIPMLCDRARALAERDFMAVLRDVLPKAALKNIALDK